MLPASSVSFVAHYVRRRPWQFSALALLVATATFCSVAAQYGMKLIVDEMALGDRRSTFIWLAFGLFLGLIAVESTLSRVAGWLGCRTIVQTGVEVRLDLFRHLSGHPMQFFAGQLSGALGSRITASAGAIGSALGSLTWHILPPCIDFLGAVIVLSTIDVRMAVALIAAAAIVALTITLYGGQGRPLHRAFAEQGSTVAGQVVDVVVNMWTVKAFSARKREHARLCRAFDGEATAQERSWLYVEKTRVLHDICLWLLAGAMLFWALYGWRQGAHTPGDVVVISALTFRILHGSRDLGMSLVGVEQQLGTIGEMLKIIGGRHVIDDATEAVPLRSGPGSIDLNKVTYRYENGRCIFKDFSLHIPAGQRVGVIGPSGAGKSTLIGLIQRLDDVQTGEVLIDGQSIERLQQESLRQAIAVVPQEVSLFHRSVLDNIRYGNPEATSDEIRRAVAAAGCAGFIDALPQGFDTLVGERGVMLSGGQRQRIGIARAFLKNARILLLDEATSALDSVSEQEIRRAIDRLLVGRTVVAVAHRLATVATFDRIIVLVDGVVTEDGPPSRLREAGGHFQRLWELQANGLEPGLALQSLCKPEVTSHGGAQAGRRAAVEGASHRPPETVPNTMA